jgi:hypothetical protein
METSLEFLSLTEAEKAMDYYENQPDQLRFKLVPIPSPCGATWRLEVMPPVMSAGISGRQVAPQSVSAEAAVAAV